MTISYDSFASVFLSKVTSYKFLRLTETNRTAEIDGYMKRACSQFGKICKFDIVNGDDEKREFVIDNISDAELNTIIDIVTDGMIVQWMKPYIYAGDNLKNMINTTDFSAYSPAELLHRIKDAYTMCDHDYTRAMREYSYSHGDLTDLYS